jgi:hypothetical protein
MNVSTTAAKETTWFIAFGIEKKSGIHRVTSRIWPRLSSSPIGFAVLLLRSRAFVADKPVAVCG